MIVAVRASVVMIQHPNRSIGRCSATGGTDRCGCVALRSRNQTAARLTPAKGISHRVDRQAISDERPGQQMHQRVGRRPRSAAATRPAASSPRRAPVRRPRGHRSTISGSRRPNDSMRARVAGEARVGRGPELEVLDGPAHREPQRSAPGRPSRSRSPRRKQLAVALPLRSCSPGRGAAWCRS